MAAWIKVPLGMEVGLGPADFVLDGDRRSPSPKGDGAPSIFSAHFYCGQTAGCIKMPLGMEVGLSPGDFMLDGDPALSQKGGGPLIFGPYLFDKNMMSTDFIACRFGTTVYVYKFSTKCILYTGVNSGGMTATRSQYVHFTLGYTHWEIPINM